MLCLAPLERPVEPSEVNSLLVSNNLTAKIADRAVDAIRKGNPALCRPPPSRAAVTS